MIANCPTCGTHYKHPPPAMRVRARCLRCDTTLFLARLRPYRIVAVAEPSLEQSVRAVSHFPIGLDHPALATTIVRNIERHSASDDPLPQIHEMAPSGEFASVVPSDAYDDILGLGARHAFDRKTDADPAPEAASAAGSGAATFALWLATGAIAGTGASWTMGGTTMSGIAVGVALGAVTGWGWHRWTSPK